MSHHIRSNATLRNLCAELGDEDGIDPRISARRLHGRALSRRHFHAPAGVPLGAGVPAAGRPQDRKVCQLCRQVALTLDEVFAECADPLIQNLRVAEVTPMPDGTRLLVTVAPLVGQLEPAVRPQAILSHLERASGHLRYQVASSITRKRAPLLNYRLADVHAANP